MPILEKCNIQQGEVYWDLGCGAGKSLIAAGLLQPQLGKIKGVEYLEGIFEQTKRVENLVKENNIFQIPDIEIQLNDMLEID